jgi:hypothetical protein
MMSYADRRKATHSMGDGKHHINKSVFIDMIVLALVSGYLNLRPVFFADSRGFQ